MIEKKTCLRDQLDEHDRQTNAPGMQKKDSAPPQFLN